MSEPKAKTPDPEIIRHNAEAFEALARQWIDSRTGKPVYPACDLLRAVIHMILDYFDYTNSAALYYGNMLGAIEEKPDVVRRLKEACRA